MERKTAKLVNEQRVVELLQCYGGDAANWPEEERLAANALIKNSVDLQQRQHEARQLDEIMGIAHCRESLSARPDATAVANIVNALPEQPANNTVNLNGFREQQTERSGGSIRSNTKWFYSVAAAAAMVLLAVGIIVQQPSQPLQPPQPMRTAAISQQEMDVWMWQEATGLSDESEQAQEDGDPPLTFLAMVDLELQPTEE